VTPRRRCGTRRALPPVLRPQQRLTPLFLAQEQHWQFADPARTAGASFSAGQPFRISFADVGGTLAVDARGTVQALLDDCSLVMGRRWAPEQDSWEYRWLPQDTDLVTKLYAVLPMADRLDMLRLLRNGDATSLAEAQSVAC